jgi:diguanylate cyclase (GGDEF)-like protein
MAKPTPDPAARGMREHAWDERLAVRNRIARAALVLVLLAVSVFVVWSSQATSNAATRAATANHLSDLYAQAAVAVNAQESLERKYRLEPGVEVRKSFNEAADALVSGLGRIRKDGGAEDRVFVNRSLMVHRDHLAAIDRLFTAVDRGDTATVLLIDGDEVDPMSASLQKAVFGASVRKHQVALDELAHLQQLETLNRKLTPLVFLGGLALVAVLASITRGYRRLLEVERARAVHDSLHDALTGLPNRTLLADRLEQALSVDARLGTSTGLLLIDLDRFKDVNDTFGHDYGDKLLTQVGTCLAGAVAGRDTVARLGGDEFAVLLVDVGSLDNAMGVAARLRAALETPFLVEGLDLDVEASIGVVLSGMHGQDTTTLLRRADIAMYVAKAQNLGVCAFAPDDDGHTPTKLALLGELRRALERGELILHYQPQINVSTGDVVGVEALIRWQHPERGLIQPDDFIPLAEHTGLIGPLTSHVLDVALAQARKWSDAGRPLTVSVNLSARNLLDEGLPGEVKELLGAHGVAPELLNLEVTESATMTEPVRAKKVLEELSTLGIRISLDDFGSGYTSLGQLKDLPISELKIDRSFVMAVTGESSNALIVRSVVELGHNLGLTIVAEGVETQQILSAVAGLGCDVAQGYHLSHPITAGAFDTWCSGRRITPIYCDDGLSHQDEPCDAFSAGCQSGHSDSHGELRVR